MGSPVMVVVVAGLNRADHPSLPSRAARLAQGVGTRGANDFLNRKSPFPPKDQKNHSEYFRKNVFATAAQPQGLKMATRSFGIMLV
jgi:hypothetical protein